jgi:hypothetical protein
MNQSFLDLFDCLRPSYVQLRFLLEACDDRRESTAEKRVKFAQSAFFACSTNYKLIRPEKSERFRYEEEDERQAVVTTSRLRDYDTADDSLGMVAVEHLHLSLSSYEQRARASETCRRET